MASGPDLQPFLALYLFSHSVENSITGTLLSGLASLVPELNPTGPAKLLNSHVAIQTYSIPLGGIAITPSYIRTVRGRPSTQAFEKDNDVSTVLLQAPDALDSARPLRLAVFDMDSTLIQQEIIDELASLKNLGPLVSSITERAMRGELDFAASLKERCKLLEGIAVPEVWETLRSRIQFAEGARELCGELKKRGVKMAVLSGGFQEMANWVKGELGLDYAFANYLESSAPTKAYPFQHLTGNLLPVETHPIVTANRKKQLLLQIAVENDVLLNDVLCVGDGANDLEMLNAVHDAGGMGIAFKAKEKVQRDAGNSIKTGSLKDLLWLIGGK